MKTITTASGNVYCVSEDGRYAWPQDGPGTAFGPYDRDCARARGEEVDRDIPQTDYRVTNAGKEWKEVYDLLHAD